MQDEKKSTFIIESRAQLVSALAEAAEIEHNLLCLYLYAMFSLKRSESEGITTEELEAIGRWRQTILGIALEEMTHLTLVSNLVASTGRAPSFMRPNFPCSPGPYPADMVIELAGFDMDTLDHFIYLERPRAQNIEDSFEHIQSYTRVSEKGRLMAHSGDYKTVGALYLSIRDAFEDLCEKYGEKNMFCGAASQQVGPLDSPLPGLILVTNKAQAMTAIDTIITQGEGATNVVDSHFQRFIAIKNEYKDLLLKNPNFVPARAVARNPVMRKPIEPEGRVWITEPLAAKYVDLANALYTMMLFTLVQIYNVENRPKEAKDALLSASYGMMRAMATVGETLTYLPANSENPNVLSGMSFAMVRSLSPLQRQSEKQIIKERFIEVLNSITGLQKHLDETKSENPHVQACADQLHKTAQELKLIESQLANMPETIETSVRQTTVAAPVKESAKTSSQFAHCSEPTPDVEISETEKIKLMFVAKRCIHSRHCVTELPNVFFANTPGKWLFAEKADPEILAAVSRECPSGAIQYKRKDGGPDETAPGVNLMRVRENGPYAFLADLQIDGKEQGMRATLCRCGQSQNKPYCDGAHNAAGFSSSGEPSTLDDTALKVRNGKLKINRSNNGPLLVSGNVEICAGTGRVLLRTQNVALCRCGNSKKKPVCDSSHIAANFKDAVDV